MPQKYLKRKLRNLRLRQRLWLYLRKRRKERKKPLGTRMMTEKR